MPADIAHRDYSVTFANLDRARDQGLASGNWYRTPIPRPVLKELMQRRDGPALRDIIIWFGILIVSGLGGYLTWGTWWCVPFFFVYGTVYGGSSDSRWHECGHGTAFKTRWMNNVVYQIASFMVLREPTVWKWSHTRHHTDTIIVGADPEIAVPRPPDVLGMLLNLFALKSGVIAFKHILLHAAGTLTEAERTFIPEMEQYKVFRTARIWCAIYAAVILLALATRSFLPLMYIGLPSFYGAWYVIFMGLTQHAGLAEDVLDHRLNTRTVYMNPVFRYLYWNMNYHVEHHMFPLIPYHALPRLHELVRNDTPPPYHGVVAAYAEIFPALAKQVKDPRFHIVRPLPPTAGRMPEEKPRAGAAAAARGAA